MLSATKASNAMPVICLIIAIVFLVMGDSGGTLKMIALMFVWIIINKLDANMRVNRRIADCLDLIEKAMRKP